MFNELKIGTAAPTQEQLSAVNHLFIGNKSIHQYYSSGQYELDAIPIIEDEIRQHNNTLLVGGSMLYVDAICKGIDDIPTIDNCILEELLEFYRINGR